MRTRTARHVALWLGGFSSLGLIASILALQDIFHGEPDLSLEWSVLRVAFLLSIAFHFASMVALSRSAASPAS
jgi:hypothetical protein